MEAELLSVTDNTVRTIEVILGLTDAKTRRYRWTQAYWPHTLRAVYTKLGDGPWSVSEVEVTGYRLRKDGTPGQLITREPLIVGDGTISVSTAVDQDNDQYVASPALAALVTEHMPKDD
jgi:hypothetical protein